MDALGASRGLRSAREVAHAASQLASEAAAMARLYGERVAHDASIAAAEASILAARAALSLEGEEPRRMAPVDSEELLAAVRASLASVEAAAAAVGATKAVLEAALRSARQAVAEAPAPPV